MLTQPIFEQLYAMRLNGMADAFRKQLENPAVAELSLEERFGLLVESQWTLKADRALARRLALAHFKFKAVLEDVDFRHQRGLERPRLLSLANESRWVRLKQNVVFVGPTGIGKSYLGCALAHKACRDGFSVLYTRSPQLFRDLQTAHADGSFARLLSKLARIDVLVVDDFAMSPMSELERRDFLDICEDRYQLRSTVLTSQLPTIRWHDHIGDPTVADSILDRLVHHAHYFELSGDSLRKQRGREILGAGQDSAWNPPAVSSAAVAGSPPVPSSNALSSCSPRGPSSYLPSSVCTPTAPVVGSTLTAKNSLAAWARVAVRSRASCSNWTMSASASWQLPPTSTTPPT